MLRPRFFPFKPWRKNRICSSSQTGMRIIDLRDAIYLIKMKFSVIIATYNRAEELPKTLDSLKGLNVSEPWEVIVVDNNSSDNTREIVESYAQSFPVPLRYLMEREQGRSAALNTGIK